MVFDRSILSVRYVADDHIASARHRLVDALVEPDRGGVDEAQRGVDLALVVLVVAAVALVTLALVALTGLIERDLLRELERVRDTPDRSEDRP
jgi:hypothetical protein